MPDFEAIAKGIRRAYNTLQLHYAVKLSIAARDDVRAYVYARIIAREHLDTECPVEFTEHDQVRDTRRCDY